MKSIRILIDKNIFKRIEIIKRMAGVSWREMLIEGAREVAKRVPSYVDISNIVEGLDEKEKKIKRREEDE